MIVVDTLLAPLRALVSIEREMRAMRADMRDVLDAVNGLREDVQMLHGGVGRIGDATVNLETKVEELGVHIDALGTLAGRLGRFGSRRNATGGTIPGVAPWGARMTTTPIVTGVDFVYVPAKDFDAATDFYGSVLGLPCSARYGQMPGAEFETGTLTLAVIESEAFGIEFRALNHPLALHVDDVEATRAELESRGVTFGRDTLDSGVCHMAFFEDPNGNALMLHHRYAPRA